MPTYFKMTNSTPPAGRPTLSHHQIIAENAAITGRNQTHQTRRNQGDANVENDESLLTVPPTFTNVPTNCSPTTNNNPVGPSSTTTKNTTTNPTLPNPPISNLNPSTSKPNTPTPSASNISYANMIAAFQRLSPNKQASLQSSISASIANSSSSNPPSLPTNTSSSLIFDITNECTVQNHSINDSYGIHMYILDLARNHQHIPFSLLTTKVSKRLFLESSTLKFVTFYSSHRGTVPTKCHLIDTSQFPTESSISISEWHEAWACYLRFLMDHTSPKIHLRWTNHYQTLQEHPNFADNWTAILTFDIEQHTSYAADPQKLDEAKYFRQLESIKTHVARNESLKAISEAVAELKSHQHEPYPPRDSSFRKSQSSEKSFRNSSKPNESNERLPPLCLICGQLRHTFPSCPDASSSSLTSHSKVSNKQLVSHNNADTKYCVNFNIYCNGKRTCIKCTHKGGEIHACSLCGSTEHGVCSRKCLGA